MQIQHSTGFIMIIFIDLRMRNIAHNCRVGDVALAQGLEVRRLLACTPATVPEVARELGFDDPAYFSRFFTRRAGCSPQAWRRALAVGQATVP